MWRKLFVNHLIETNKALKIMYERHSYKYTLNIPEKLETKEEIIQFATEINEAIRFPEYSHLKKISK